ncbi:tRNA (adenosine(37)-N6)-threonylcarbamoyltransferase complex transferase subunit TsaD [Candidatus Similichlamydia laticola]|uniref:tRNA N6-adenosine threonylcarbamoyltransferase n=1 Tax=Candidatus Similichlamydia laticola TaxID=2170265 RepID=A0A369KCF0_9BACT|nr:tRNA (adenosine(37)-N6)-threonylcarbamoyltransferase complex transferase subunit TsaD [Candidatus Similichlamydia laticola]RDB31588.1 TsaD/Kae1/Qri7 protein, required for threonylcarbamoyladenosine t(6)A37 formation in tRNA [Candidatus Similichlamydia laticola]
MLFLQWIFEMLIIGIETTCDETAVAFLSSPLKVLHHELYSQSGVHRAKNGVVPEVAARLHLSLLLPLFDRGLKAAQKELSSVEAIAVAQGPGLIGALLVGMSFAKTLALVLDRPLICVNHVEAHLYAALMNHGRTDIKQALGIVLSGGHTFFCLMHSVGDYTYLGETQDDAIGEAFDKVAIMLQLGYPGGALLEQLAHYGNEKRFSFKAGQIEPYHVSFSGLKTAVLYKIRDLEKKAPLSAQDRADLAASFQKAAFDVVCITIEKINSAHSLKALVLGGGVTANGYLQRLLKEKFGHTFKIYLPQPALATDNAVMIAGLGAWQFQKKGASSLESKANPNLRLEC